MMAIVDYDYKFIYVNVGCQGRISDGGVFKNTDFYSKMINNDLSLPGPQTLPGVEPGSAEYARIPYVMVADDAFALSENCIKPYPYRGLTDKERIFNYRLSRMRRVTENAFGIWSNRFRVFAKQNSMSPENAEKVVLATVALHNMLREKSSELYTPSGYVDHYDVQGNLVDGDWRSEGMLWNPLKVNPKANKAPKTAKDIRDRLAEYFFDQGQVPWQWQTLI